MAKKNESAESLQTSSPTPLVPLVEIEQIAMVVPDVDQIIKQYDAAYGTTKWVIDEVDAVNIDGDLEGTKFSVKLAFNYELFPGKEFELLQVLSGDTVQKTLRPPYASALSHFGLHVADIDEWLDAHPDLKALGMYQLVLTRRHSGTERRYRYALLKTKGDYGFILKLIQRVSQ